eukprot:1161001-Pelagomonas_calceolata.AAC.10
MRTMHLRMVHGLLESRLRGTWVQRHPKGAASHGIITKCCTTCAAQASAHMNLNTQKEEGAPRS